MVGCKTIENSTAGLKLTLSLNRTSLRATDTLSGTVVVCNPTRKRYSLLFPVGEQVTLWGFNASDTLAFTYPGTYSLVVSYLELDPLGAATYAFRFVPVSSNCKILPVIAAGQYRLVVRLTDYAEPTDEARITITEAR